MFEIYDLEMNKLEFPRGVKPLDIIVSSVGKIRNTSESDGRDGIIDYGYRNDTRMVDISLWIEAKDTIDYRLLRNELFEFFTRHDKFYISEKHIPSRVLKVSVDSEIMLDRLTVFHAQVDLPCTVHGTPFWESKYTTLELHDSGYSATAEKYGLVDNIDDEKVKYRFTPDLVHTELTSDLFEQGSIFLTNGKNADSNTQLGRLKNHYSVIKGQNYQLNLSETGGTINYIRIFHYDASGNHISNEGSSNVQGNGDTSFPFVALGTSIRLLIYAYGSSQVNIGGIGTLTEISLSSVSSKSEFNVYNAGNVTVEPESSQLYIQMNNVTSDGNLKMTNKTTGETFEYYRSVSRRHIVLNGMVMTESGSNQFRNSNRRFISLAPGDNEFEITGATFDEIFFSFKYLYK